MYSFVEQVRLDWQRQNIQNSKAKKENLEVESALVFIYLECIAINGGFRGHRFIFLLLGKKKKKERGRGGKNK